MFGDGYLPEHREARMTRRRYVWIVDGELGPLQWCVCTTCKSWSGGHGGHSLTNGRRFIRAQRRARKARRGYP